MIETQEVIEFFNSIAPSWDARQIIDEVIFNRILDNAQVGKGKHCLDVACGTGVLVPYYIERKVASLTGVDIAPEMIRIARKNHEMTLASFIIGDVERISFDRLFDCVVVFNSFPHFPEPERLISRLTHLLNPGGILTVAHSLSRERIDQCHSGPASKVSIKLLPVEELETIFSRHLQTTTVISTAQMYQVVGKKV